MSIETLVYHTLAKQLLEVEELPPSPLGLPGWCFDNPHRVYNPGDLTDEDEQRLAAKVCQLVSGVTDVQWARLNENQRIPWLEAAIEQCSASIPEETQADCKVTELLTENEYCVLQQLATHRPQLIRISDLAVDLSCNRAAASEAVKQLETLKYVERPKGNRSGIGITEHGLNALRPCDRPSTG